MLLLTRKQGESIRIADNIEVRVLEVRRGQVKIGIEGPRSVSVHRQEVYDEIQRGNREQSPHSDVIWPKLSGPGNQNRKTDLKSFPKDKP